MSECTIIAAATLTFIAHTLQFLCTFYTKGTEPPFQHTSLLLDFRTCFQERTV